MLQWKWLLFLIILVVVLIFLTIYLLIKRHRGHGYFLSKFSAFTRIRFSGLEKRRQTYCPANNKCQCHLKGSAAHIEPNLLCTHRSPTLYMSFAGAAMVVGGVRTTEWRGSMREIHRDTNDEFDALFFTDPAQCFYLQDPDYQWEGLTYYRNLIKLYGTLYQRVILIGASLGGSMVCMCADLATVSIAFNPILDPVLLGLHWRIMGAFCPARQAEVVRNQVHNTMEKINTNKNDHNCVLHIHWSQLSKADQRQAHGVIGGGKHSKPIQTECLTSVLDFDIDNANMSTSSGVHIWFHRSKEHILAMQLKRTNQLIPMLKRHLTATSIGLNTISHILDEKQRQDLVIINISL
ncbi:unnamed protein product [Rotaria sordida]|uniref:Uncharacterized protein n=1 Tax=Rotaria sordida TaxID=392033 RepID=A0A813NKM3_9BILA|nr:unnamed protein product [Rotaria sordida]CAF0741175.1 unnamed protein product [Rotaria sordida]CAF0802418.1 unnamed protein product [Rotaria sordida]CAF3556291.1 unnamed protein product [Rotaria sordida]CAF3749145.1 unnamed protein product [Rotaria sordida]